MKTEFEYLILFFLAFGIAFLLSYTARRLIRVIMDRRLEEGDEDITRLKFLRNSISAVFFTMAIAYMFYEIPMLNNLGAALFAGAGVLAAIIGFASQKAFSNIISGIFILLFRPFRIGDIVEVGTGKSGTVEDITLRHTVIRDFQNRRFVIPNSIISDETLLNSDIMDERIRRHIVIGISYDSDINRAMQIMREEMESHPLCSDERTSEQKAANEPKVLVKVVSLGDSSVNIRAWVWSKNTEDSFLMQCDVLKSVKERFDREGIEIPFPHRTLVMKKSEIEDGESQLLK